MKISNISAEEIQLTDTLSAHMFSMFEGQRPLVIAIVLTNLVANFILALDEKIDKEAAFQQFIIATRDLIEDKPDDTKH